MRFENWPILLDAEIEAARQKPFVWGEHDCATWAARIVFVLTGRVLDLPKGYTTARGSALAMRRKTGTSQIEGAATFFLGEPLASSKVARRGDVVLHGSGALGVCIGSSAMCLSEAGLTAVPMSGCVTAWRV